MANDLRVVHGWYANKHGKRHNSATIAAPTGLVAGQWAWRRKPQGGARETTMAVLQDIQAELAMLRAENARLKASAASGGNGFKVSEKGALSVYGLGRFPVTLYRGQWEKLFAKVEAIKAFIEANSDRLTVKE